jgi:hypothetical protein
MVRAVSKLLLMASFLSFFFGSKGQTIKTGKGSKIFPTESFSVLEGKMADGEPVVGSINLAYKGYGLKSSYPWCLKIMIALDLDHVTEHGLPKFEESEIAYALENEFLADIKNLATEHYIGHLFTDGFLDVYIYLDEPEKVHHYLQKRIDSNRLSRGIAYEIDKDPAWEKVKWLLKG